ncbi:MAG: S-layer homology domain-containing protein [Negativicoccus succinicivorans]|uniref:S-layer homology domain-containing protein n=1 Tax=Negativicoccus succinicivorans TaxID=620903 RepID=UPI0026EC1440|nr:S-layer homology domain-containing protein [Negativicoccus succinicivorans]MBS6028298.1 S-layer homology domain-containing protein [Negativicoccus succinicivorans]
MMNKKLATVLAAACVLGATTAFAAPNPFSDVTPNDWAYQAVSQLAAEGVVEGYPDGTFKGQQNITRYEMAQMVARAMVKQDQLNAEQQAQLNRLADEFANELNSLGVRVSNLENRVGNVKLTGDARVRYMDESDDDYFDMRVRLQANAKVSEDTMVTALISSGDFGFDSDTEDPDLTLDNLYIEHGFNDNFGAKAGRYDLTLGATGVFYDDTFDGVEVDFGKNVNLAVGYGYMKAFTDEVKEYAFDDKAPKAWFVQAGTDLTDGLGVAAFYLNVPDAELEDGVDQGGNSVFIKDDLEFWGAGLNYRFNDALQLRGDYVRNTKVDNDPELWTAGVLFGAADTSKVGSFEIGADYVSVEPGAYLGGTTMTLGDPMELSFAGKTTYWQAQASFVPAENVLLSAYYAFNIDVDADDDFAKEISGAGLDDNMWGVELNYFF